MKETDPGERREIRCGAMKFVYWDDKFFRRLKGCKRVIPIIYTRKTILQAYQDEIGQ